MDNKFHQNLSNGVGSGAPGGTDLFRKPLFNRDPKVHWKPQNLKIDPPHKKYFFAKQERKKKVPRCNLHGEDYAHNFLPWCRGQDNGLSWWSTVQIPVVSNFLSMR